MQRCCWAVERRRSPPSRITMAFRQDVRYHTAEPRHTLSRSFRKALSGRGGGGQHHLDPMGRGGSAPLRPNGNERDNKVQRTEGRAVPRAAAVPDRPACTTP